MEIGSNGEDALPMKTGFSLNPGRRRLMFLALSAVLILTIPTVYKYVRAQSRPAAIVVKVCNATHADDDRIAGDFGTQFDVPKAGFVVHVWTRDMPPALQYGVVTKNGAKTMTIGHDDDTFRDLRQTFPVFSASVEQREIRGANGRVLGHDRWGYLKDGDRWRYATFLSGDAVGYPPTSAKEAALFDEVIASACVLPERKGN
jgi:hypothetical protein